MRTSSHTHRRIIIAVIGLIVKVTRLYPPKKSEVFMAKIDKARFWTGVLYPENMREDWKEVIGDTLQYPYAYCQHSQDKDNRANTAKIMCI